MMLIKVGKNPAIYGKDFWKLKQCMFHYKIFYFGKSSC